MEPAFIFSWEGQCLLSGREPVLDPATLSKREPQIIGQLALPSAGVAIESPFTPLICGSLFVGKTAEEQNTSFGCRLCGRIKS